MIATVWAWVLSVLSWFHQYVVVPLVQAWDRYVLSTWEEAVLSSFRGWSQEVARTVNGVSAWFLSRFYRDYRDSLRKSWDHNPWQNWWSQVQTRPSTLNAIIASMQQGANACRQTLH